MFGAIAGDVIGSVHEFRPTKSKDFDLFEAGCKPTDDSYLTIAVAEALLGARNYKDCIRSYAKRYPDGGYGGMFYQWIHADNAEPYNSFGNGSAMRVSAVAWAAQSEQDVLAEAANSAAVTHNHPEGIKGAQAVALAVWLARHGADKAAIKTEISTRFGYDLNRSVDDIRPDYRFDETCPGSVPESILCFLQADSFEDTLRNAVSLGGDADTMAAIAGSIAEPYYKGVPDDIAAFVWQRLDEPCRSVLTEFGRRFGSQVVSP